MFKNHEVAKIVYTNRNKETSERDVVPFNVAPKNIKAIDVSGLAADKQAVLVDRMVEYQEYLEERAKLNFNFEDWLEQSHQETPELKWRTFDPANVNFL